MKDLCDRSRAADRRQIEGGARRKPRADSAGHGRTRGADRENSRRRPRFLGRNCRSGPSRFTCQKVLKNAGVALATIIAAPYIIRLFCYSSSPRRRCAARPIRIAAMGATGPPIPPTARSTTSVDIQLQPGEELLVKHGYLQATSERGAKETQWLLDGRHPISSLATGLTFLTRIRGDGEVTGVSAVRDPFAEVTVMTLPAGAACVLQPRALAAVAEPMDRRLRISAHWRLFSLNAWLTLQLRYLVFHGPARLVLKARAACASNPPSAGVSSARTRWSGFPPTSPTRSRATRRSGPISSAASPCSKDRVAAGGRADHRGSADGRSPRRSGTSRDRGRDRRRHEGVRPVAAVSRARSPPQTSHAARIAK